MRATVTLRGGIVVTGTAEYGRRWAFRCRGPMGGQMEMATVAATLDMTERDLVRALTQMLAAGRAQENKVLNHKVLAELGRSLGLNPTDTALFLRVLG